MDANAEPKDDETQTDDEQLIVDYSMCYLTYPCKHQVSIGKNGKPALMGGVEIVALHQMLGLPIDEHFNYIAKDKKFSERINITRSAIEKRFL
jgi:hypothetical protein